MKLLSLVLASLFAEQSVADASRSGYEIAASALKETSDNSDVRGALDSLYETSPELFRKYFTAQAAPKPVPVEPHSKWDTVFRRDDIPDRVIRVKNPASLGIDTVKQHTGYFDMLDKDKHMFFWMFESRNDPKNDPIVLWLNGGPGCSVATGLFFELGPASIQEDLTLKSNPHSWNNNATVIFLDSPVNAGFSYSSQRVNSAKAAANDVYEFLSFFFEVFSEFKSNKFHIAGESYSGHYIPAIGQTILEHPERNFNVSSLLIGNGMTDMLNQGASTVPMQCGEGGFPSVQSAETCKELNSILPRCQSLMQSCSDTKSRLSCIAAAAYCESIKTKYIESGRNIYDVRDVCNGDYYPQARLIEKYLNQKSVQEVIGSEPTKFIRFNHDIEGEFFTSGDQLVSYAPAVAKILAAEIPVLIYAGDMDWICNWIGNLEWTNRMEWPHQEEYVNAEVNPWYVDGKEAGTTKNADLLTFLRIYGAGHLAPLDQPRNTAVMLNHWLSGNLRFDGQEGEDSEQGHIAHQEL